MAITGLPKPKLITADTNVLIDLADDNEVVIDCFDVIRSRLRNASILITPTVIQELAELVETGETAKTRACAEIALRSLIKPWGFCPVNCIPVGHGIVEETARKLRAKRLVPEEEIHDSFVLAESALADASMLISNDHHLKDIKHEDLQPVLTECDLSVPLIVSPWKIRAFSSWP